jgi:hypothetical protein
MCAGQFHKASVMIGTLEIALPSANKLHQYRVEPCRVPAFLLIFRCLFLPSFRGREVNREKSKYRNVNAPVVFGDDPPSIACPTNGGVRFFPTDPSGLISYKFLISAAGNGVMPIFF